MKKGTIWIIIIAIIVLVVMWFVRINNRMVEAQEQAVQAWAQVENVYQRRADLIPNLVNTVKGAVDFEKSTLEAVIEARSRATSITVDPTNLTEESMAAFQDAQDNLSQSLGRLMAVVERIRTSWNCRHSWKVRKTGLPWKDVLSTRWFRLTTC